MTVSKLSCAIATGMLAAYGLAMAGVAAKAQTGVVQTEQVAAGGRLHGVVKSGTTPLPGVTVTAQNTLTGKRVSTTTDISGTWSLTLAQNGRYVVRTQFAAFAQGAQEAVLNAASHEQVLTFDLQLASRAAAAEQAQTNATENAATQIVQQLTGNGAQNLSLLSSLSAGTETQGSNGAQGASGAELPQMASNADFNSDSVAISGQSGQVSPLAGMDMDRLRDAMETVRSQLGAQGGQAGGLFGGGGFGGGGGGFGGGMGGPGGGGGRGGRGGNFRGFNPGQPHGAVFWTGSNSALNAEPFSLKGQSQNQPASGTNRFGITFMSAPYIPGLTKPSGKDTFFLTLSGQRSSSPVDDYAIVPTGPERGGDFSASGLPAIYDPTTTTQTQFTGNVIPTARISTQATALLTCPNPVASGANCQPFFPEPNLSGNSNGYNYHLLTTQQNNQTQAGVRYMRSLGANATQPGGGRGGIGRGMQRNQGLRQSINFNYNWSHSAADNVNEFPQLGGKNSSSSNSLQAGYTVGYKRVTSISNASWNRSQSQTTNFFTSGEDIATKLGILGPGSQALNSSALNYGLPNVTMSSIAGLSQQQPSFSIAQTIALSETVSWIHKKHNLRFGGDYRRVHRDFLGGSNATGTFTFSGLFTEDAKGDSTTGSPIADLLLGLPQSTTIDTSVSKSYLRDNVLDAFAQDDWRATPSLTFNFGLRYEYFAPYTEKYGHLAAVDTNQSAEFSSQTEVQANGVGASSGHLPNGLVFPFHKDVSPRVAFAWRVPRIKQMVLRGGYGLNFTVGQYASFATTMAHQPIPNNASFVNEQTNEEAVGGTASSACAKTSTCFTLADGFGAADTVGNYAVNPHYQLPHVQVWNVNLQKTLPWGMVLNAGYNGSKGGDLDIKSAPRATTTSPNTDPTNQVFTYEQSVGASRFNAGTLSLQKRLSSGIAAGVFYQYAHSIDNAASMAQDWQNLGAEEGNSNSDVRHSVNGTYLYELPFGKDKWWVTSGTASHILEGFSISGTFKFATGTPLTPTYQAAKSDVTQGTAGTLRPDRVAGQSITAGGGSLKKWFNTAAFQTPAGSYGTASRNSIRGPGIISNNLTLSKTMQLGDTRSWEFRATANNAFNTVQYSGVDTNFGSPATVGQVNAVAAMRAFSFESRFRF